MLKTQLPTPDTLRKLLHCEPDKGFLFWRARPVEMFKDGTHSKQHRCNCWNSRYSGKRAVNTIDTDGYLRGTILNKEARAHRVIWAMETGDWPVEDIDHENHIRNDNRFKNLREVDRVGNARNMRMSARNTSGITGVSFVKDKNVWRAQIGVMNKRVYLGNYALKSDAITARKNAEIKYNFHTNHGVNKC